MTKLYIVARLDYIDTKGISPLSRAEIDAEHDRFLISGINHNRSLDDKNREFLYSIRIPAQGYYITERTKITKAAEKLLDHLGLTPVKKTYTIFQKKE